MAGIAWGVKGQIDLDKLKRMLGPSDDVLTGYVEGMPHPEADMNMDELARTLSNGSAEMPARPFLEEGILEEKAGLTPMIEDHYRKRVAGGPTRVTLQAIGAFCVGAVKKFVFGDYYRSTVPNAPSTIDRKSRRQKGKYLLSDKPLIDRGLMINATTFVVRKGKQ